VNSQWKKKSLISNYVKIKNHKKWENEKIKQNYERVKHKAHNIRRTLYGVSPPPPLYYTDSGFDNDHSDEELIDLSEDTSLKLNFNRR
jgi:hypothetical protein